MSFREVEEEMQDTKISLDALKAREKADDSVRLLSQCQLPFPVEKCNYKAERF